MKPKPKDCPPPPWSTTQEGGVPGQSSPPSQAGHTPDPDWAPRDPSVSFSLFPRWFLRNLSLSSSATGLGVAGEPKTLRNKNESVCYSLIPRPGNQRVSSTFSLIRSAARLSKTVKLGNRKMKPKPKDCPPPSLVNNTRRGRSRTIVPPQPGGPHP